MNGHGGARKASVRRVMTIGAIGLGDEKPEWRPPHPRLSPLYIETHTQILRRPTAPTDFQAAQTGSAGLEAQMVEGHQLADVTACSAVAKGGPARPRPTPTIGACNIARIEKPYGDPAAPIAPL